MSRQRFIFAVSLTGAIVCSPVNAADWYVDASSTHQNPDGTDWEKSYPSLQSVLLHQNLQAGDLIKIADGTYKPGTSSSDSFTIEYPDHEDIIIRGGYRGYNTQSLDPDENDPLLFPTILSGDIGTTGVHTDNCYHVIYAEFNTPAEFTLENLTIKHGYADGSSVEMIGGGMYTVLASPQVINCIFENNYASNEGAGAICNDGGTPRFERCTFRNNSALKGGGLAVNSGTDAIIINCRFHNNSASNFGGGFSSRSASPRIISCTFHDNSTSFDGGGVYIENDGAEQTQVTNCLFYSNTAGNGGGLFSTFESYKIANCTFADNTASNSGHSIYIEDDINFTVEIVNCICWNEDEVSGHITDAGAATVTVDNSIVQGGWGGSGSNNSTDNPDFLGPCNDLYRLKAGSPAIDAGDRDLIHDDEFDIDGNSDDDEETPDRDIKLRVSGSEIDMGCYEDPAPCECPGDANGDGVVNVNDLSLVTNTWGTCACSSCPGDVHPTVCEGNGTINTDDLLMVINNWGPCEEGFGPPPGPPQEIEDCLEGAEQECSEDWECFIEFVRECMGW